MRYIYSLARFLFFCFLPLDDMLICNALIFRDLFNVFGCMLEPATVSGLFFLFFNL